MKKIFTLLIGLIGLAPISFAQYCASNATSTVDDDIGQVIVGSLVNPVTPPASLLSNASSTGTYSNFTASVPAANYIAGQSYPVSITQINSGTFAYGCWNGIWIDVNQNNIFDTNEYLFNGGTGSGNGNPVTGTLTIPLTSLTGLTRMRVVMTESASATTVTPCGTYTWGETEDYLVNILPPPANDIGISQILSIPSGCGLSATTPVTVEITNFGTNAQTNPAVHFNVDNGAVVNEIAVMSLPGTTTTIYTFTNTANLSAPGYHTIKAWTSMPGDQYSFNDTSYITVYNKPAIAGFPYTETFDVPGGVIPTGWENSTADGGDWEFFNLGQWPTYLPPNDHTSGTGYFAVVMDDFDADSVILITPCFDLSGMTNAQLGFWYYSFNQNGSSPTTNSFLHIDVQHNGVTDYDVIQPIGSATNQWNNQLIDLTPYINQTVGVRFRTDNNNNFSFSHNIAIDDINVKELLPFDASPVSVANPVSGCGLGLEPITIAVVNTGTNAWSSIPLHYSIDGGTVINETYNGPAINPGDTLIYTFTNLGNFSVPMIHNLVVFSTLPLDTNYGDDTLSVPIQTIPTISTFPYLETFATGNGGWIPGGTNSDWGFGTPSSAVINTAFSAPNCWKTNLTGTNISSANSYVESPCFDLSALNAPVFESAVFWNSESGWDGAVLLSSINSGATWQLVGQFGNPNNWYSETSINASPGTLTVNPAQDGWAGVASNNGSGQWVIAKHDLIGLQNQPAVKFRIAFASDFSINYDGFAFDNVHIYEKPPFDLGVISLVNPSMNFCTTPTTPFTVDVQNFGSQPQSNVNVVLEVTNPLGTVNSYPAVLAGPLAVGTTAPVTFPTVATTWPGVYTYKAYTSAVIDPLHNNDTTYGYIKVAVTPDLAKPSDTVICDSGIVTLYVTNQVPGAFYYWYDAPNGTLLTTGTSYTTPIVTATTTYYVEALSYLEHNLGKENKTGSGFNTSFPNNNGLLFDVISPAILDSVTIYPGGAGSLSLAITDPSGAILSQMNVSYPAPNVPGERVRIPVGVPLNTPGAGYSIRCNSSTNSIFYNYTNAVYPYTDPSNSVSITGNTSGFSGYYYYFFDWTISVLGCSSGLDSGTVTLSTPPLPSLGADAITCSGYQINGTTPTAVSYLWNTNPVQTNPIISVNTSGQYVILASNQYGCVGTDTVNVSVLPTPTVNLGPDVSGCIASTILNAGSQPSGTTYLWSNMANYATTQSVNVTQSGTYSVNVTNQSGCTDTDTINVALNGVDVNLGPDVVACTPSVTLNAGNPGASYVWSNSSTAQMISVTQAGTYSVVVSSNGCSDTDVINVSFGVAPTVNLGPDLTVCNGTTISAGNPGASYSWSNGQTGQSINVTQTGTYSVGVNYSGGCTTIDQINVTVYTPPVANFVLQSSNPSTGFFQFNANGTTGSLPLIFNWSFGDGTTSNIQNPQHVYQQAGSYLVTLIVINPTCGNDTMTMTVETNYTNGIEDALSIKDLQIFPNPNQGEFTVSSASLEANELQISVLDIQGKELYRKDIGKVNGFTHTVSFSNLAQGVYFVKVSDGKRSTYNKVIVE